MDRYNAKEGGVVGDSSWVKLSDILCVAQTHCLFLLGQFFYWRMLVKTVFVLE